MALRRDGTVVAWGDNYYGQLNVPAGLRDVKSIAAGDTYSMALRRDGTLVTWGDETAVRRPTHVGADVTAISAFTSHAVALLRDGTAVEWRSGTESKLPFTNLVSVTAGQGQGLALRKR